MRRCARLAPMTISLPADPAHARSLTDVVPDLLAAIAGSSDRLAPVRSGIVLVIDGLGARNLADRAGHARFLRAHTSRKDVACSVFPSTTASALTSLLTGAPVGEHGLVGYRALVPGTDTLRNQLTDWGAGMLDPLRWQRAASLLAAASGAPRFVVTKPDYAGTGFTVATMRGAEFHGERDVFARVELAAALARRHDGALVYVYAPELDAVGHKRGVESDEWAAALETVDAAARRLHEGAGHGVGVLVTADHGMVDVPRRGHVLLQDGDPLLAGVRHIGGEPRMLHLYAEPGAAESVRTSWEAEAGRAWVFARDEAIAAGLFGPHVDDVVRERIGDVLVAARSRIAYYDARPADTSAQKMIGQHGSLTPEERIVPLVRLGAFARG